MKRISSETVEMVKALANEYSNAEIAASCGICERSVRYILSESGISKSKNAVRDIRARVRRNLYKSERRRQIFGLEGRTKIKVFNHQDLTTLRGRLKKYGYIIARCGKEAAYDCSTVRNKYYEAKGEKLGFSFIPI